jgi:type I restriction enzyme S subunit
MWAEIPAKDFCASVRDGTHDSPKPVESGRYLITSRHIIGGKIDLSNAYLISNDDFEAINKRSKVDQWDVLISMIGTVGEPCLVTEEPEFAIKNIGLFKTKGELEGKWLYYYLISPQAQSLIRQYSRGTTQAYVPLGALRDLPVRVPNDKEVMRAITNVLGKLDDKIDLNRRINQTLEAMAQAIFKSWFVDFDPVKAKIAAKQEDRDPLRAAMTAISGKPDAELNALPPEQYAQLAATAALFPDEMEESELGEIPKGWAFQSAEALAEVGIGKTPPRKEPQWFTEGEDDWRWVSIKDMGASSVFQQRSSEFLTADAVSRFNVRVVPDRTVLLSFKLTIGRVAITDGPMVTNEAIAHFKLPSDGAISSEYLYLYLKGFDYSSLGSTSSIADAVNSKTIREIPITVASRDLIDRFTKSVAPLFEEMRNRQNEIASLGATRDTLLPKLLSSEIEVPV